MNLKLKCKRFKKNLLEAIPSFNGAQYIFVFDNDFGASVIKHKYSYGYEEDLWELAVIKVFRDVNNDDIDYNVTYDTGITCDVEGYLTDRKVRKLLKKIKALRPINN